MTNADDDEPSIETRLEALAHRVDWIDRDRLSIRHTLWVWMAEQLLSVFGAIILVGLLAGVSGVVSWDVIIPWLDTLLSGAVGILAVLTFVARVSSVVTDWREQSRANRSLIESDTEDDP
jgi:hypothetical protein